ncbi:efflux transporter, RND family, MFP subunit [Gemmatirosa kalamazoonensis]|uniref:Efflux transporter, RND family, MFP subunit n=1 Tax=Gemmatirosa kalamazoonensis TaxID=861299 RepID=W0RLI5_9BACT|nr:efflux RND transporter periplasmic adaptor subunit [Gemmatirosa kalamazoonensis]AHG91302.1 efflux transporter, RND family, MFP subunit [Gemmatirosa kalamazoonensis]
MTTPFFRSIRWVLLCAGVACSRTDAGPKDTGAATAATTGAAATTGSTGETVASHRGGFTLTAEQRARLHVATVQPTSYNRVVQATGTVAFNGDRSTPVLSPISGPALRIMVNPGAVVGRGAPLATVSSPDFATAVADFRKAESNYRNLKRIADLDQQLWNNDAIARRDLEQAQTDAAAAAADRDAAIEQIKSLGVGADQIAALTAGHSAGPLEAIIRAPIAGTVVEKLISPGQLLQAGSTQCFTIADLSTMWVMASVFAGDLGTVSVGEPVDVFTDASPRPIVGKVDYVAALVDPASKAVAVRVLVPNVGRALRKDMFVRVAIHASRPQTGIVIPSSAVLRDENNLPFVFVAAKDGSFNRRQITLGSQIGDAYEVPSGLAAGDAIVTDGALFLQFAESQ